MANVHPRYSKFFQTTKSESESEEELRSYTANKELVSSLLYKDGFYLYGNFWLRESVVIAALSAHKQFKSYPDDIFLNTYFKSGTTWIRALAFAVVNRRKFSFDDHPLLTTHPQEQEIATYFEGVFGSPQAPDVDILSRPRIFASHLAYSLLPDSAKDVARFVYVCRDPKDVLVSWWHYRNTNRWPNIPFKPLDKMFDDFCNGPFTFGPIWDHQMEYKKESMKRPDKVLVLEYEEMQKKPEECVRRLAEFLGQPFTGEEAAAGMVEKIVRLCSFEFLKELKVNNEGVHEQKEDFVLKNSAFFRKGKVGDWKEHLTPEMAEKIDRITKEKMSQYGIV